MLVTILLILTALLVTGIFVSLYDNADADLASILGVFLLLVGFIGWGLLGVSIPQKTVHTTQMVVVSQTPTMTIFSDKDQIVYSTTDHQTYQLMKDKSNACLYVTSKLNMYGGTVHSAYSAYSVGEVEKQ